MVSFAQRVDRSVGFWLLISIVAAAEAAPAVEIAPFEPVVMEVPIQHGASEALLNHPPLPLSVELRMPSGRTESFFVPPSGMLGLKVSPQGAESALWLIVDPNHPQGDVFADEGVYLLQADGASAMTVNVSLRSADEAEMAPLFRGHLLTSISLLTNGTEINETIKAACEQVIVRAPLSRYADYATAYLAVHRYYASEQAIDPQALMGRPPPDLALNARRLVGDLKGLDPKLWPLRGLVLYYRGYGQASAGHPELAIPTLRTLSAELKSSPWSGRSEILLVQMEREKPKIALDNSPSAESRESPPISASPLRNEVDNVAPSSLGNLMVERSQKSRGDSILRLTIIVAVALAIGTLGRRYWKRR